MPIVEASSKIGINPNFDYNDISSSTKSKPTRQPRRCLNCEKTGCVGASGAGQRGVRCKSNCVCGMLDCFGGKVIVRAINKI